MKTHLIGISGIDMGDRHSEAMFRSTIQELSSRLPFEFLRIAPHDKLRHKPTVILDLSSSAYSDMNSRQEAALRDTHKLQQKLPNVPWIFLPQTFGPFKGIESSARKIFYNHTVFAADLHSHLHLESLHGDFQLFRAPAVTWNLKGNHTQGAQAIASLGLNPLKPLIAIDADPSSYLHHHHSSDVLGQVVACLQSHAQILAIPRKGNAGQVDLPGKCSSPTFPTLPSNISPALLKGVLSHIDLLISSDLHPTISALSLGKPIANLNAEPCHTELMQDFLLPHIFESGSKEMIQNILQLWNNAAPLSSHLQSAASQKQSECTRFFDFLSDSITSLKSKKWAAKMATIRSNQPSDPSFAYFQFRRHIHRLEKGLTLHDQTVRPEPFGEAYLGEIIDFIAQSVPCDSETLDWGHRTLQLYFHQFPSSPLRAQYEKVRPINQMPLRSLPKISEQIPLNFTLDDFELLSQNRRSVRHFLPQCPDRQLIDRCLNIALQSPSACNRQAFRLSYHTGESAKVIADIPFGAKGINPPALLVLIARYDGYSDSRDVKCPIIDASLFAMSFMLALTACGLSSLSINFPEAPSLQNKIEEYCPLANHESVVILVGIGYANDSKSIAASQKRSLDELVTSAS